MQLEGGRAGEDAALIETIELSGEKGVTRCQGTPESDLLPLGGLDDAITPAPQARKGVTHRVDGGVDQSRRDRLFGTELPGVSNRATKQSAQHVAASFIGGHYAVGNHVGDGTSMVGHDPQTDVRALVLSVGVTGGTFSSGQHRAHQIRVEHLGNVLKQDTRPLQSQPGVDVLGGEISHDVVRLVLDVLHEHQVPELHKALFVHDRTALRPEIGAAVVEDLRSRTGRPGHAHLPEVLRIWSTLHSVGTHADAIYPDLFGFLVVFVHGEPEPVWIHSIVLRDQLVCE